MLIHNVYFWLRKDLDAEQITQFRTDLESLKNITYSDAVHVGSPAAVPERPIIINDYDFCITVTFKDVQAHNAYQKDPIHKAFIMEHKEKWEQVRVYDAD